jgi:hypothetical protein
MTFEEWYQKITDQHAGVGRPPGKNAYCHIRFEDFYTPSQLMKMAWDAAQEETKRLKAKIKQLKKDATNPDIHEMDYWRIVERLAELDI